MDAHARAEDWPKKLELSDHIISTYAKVVGSAFKVYGIRRDDQRTNAQRMPPTQSLNAIEAQRGGDAKSSPLTITAAIPYTPDAGDGGETPGESTAVRPAVEAHDVLVFPDNIRVHNVSADQSTLRVPSVFPSP